MPRIRTIKPEFFLHGDLYGAGVRCGQPQLRLLYVALWCIADREGRFKWRADAIKAQALPYDKDVDVAVMLDALEEAGFIVRYVVDGEAYGWIPTLTRHQRIRSDEAASTLPGVETPGCIKSPRADRQQPARVVICGPESALNVECGLPGLHVLPRNPEESPVSPTPPESTDNNPRGLSSWKWKGSGSGSGKELTHCPADKNSQVDAPGTDARVGVNQPLELTQQERAWIDGTKSPIPPYQEIVEYLNDKAGSSYSHEAQSTRMLIRTLWLEGRTLADFQFVIDSRIAAWKDRPEMRDYLRPKTLFSGANFESYLGAPAELQNESMSERRARRLREEARQ